jgi:hypothetical protein
VLGFIGIECLEPPLKLTALGSGREEALGEWDDRCSMRATGSDAQCRGRAPVAPRRGLDGDGAESEEGLEGLEEGKVPNSHSDVESKAELRAAVAVGGLLPGDEEAAFAGNEAAEHVAG